MPRSAPSVDFDRWHVLGGNPMRCTPLLGASGFDRRALSPPSFFRASPPSRNPMHNVGFAV
jgi:hypothetical protein